MTTATTAQTKRKGKGKRLRWVGRACNAVAFLFFVGCLSLPLTAADALETPLYPAHINTEVNGGIERKYGYISEDGVWVIPPLFEDADAAQEPTAKGYRYAAKQGGKWGFIDFRGNWAAGPAYDFVADFHCERARVVLNGCTAFIDPDGKKIMAFDRETEVMDFCEGISAKNKAGTDSYTFMDVNGDTLFHLENAQSLFSDHDGFYKLCAEGLIQVKRNEKWGFVDQQGNWVIQPEFDAVDSFSEGLAAARNNGKWGFIDRSGAWRIYPQFEKVKRFSEGLAAVMPEKRWVFIDREGNSPFQNQYLYLPMPGADRPYDYVFHNGLACAYYADNGIYGGFIDTQGRWAIPPKFRYVMPFRNGVTMVDTGDTVGYINQAGEWVFTLGTY